jgi:AcrR family transcriptional regulator
MKSQLEKLSDQASPRYHHGDLSSAALEEGLRLLKLHQMDQLSLRNIARNVGVTAPALYRHYPNKQSLLNALALHGLDLLAKSQIAATKKAGGGLMGFNASGCAYVRFALANPALFRLMMSCGPQDGNTAMQFLLENVDDLAPPGIPESERHAYAMRSWAIVHGVATLMLDGMLPTDSDLIEAIICAPEQFLEPKAVIH